LPPDGLGSGDGAFPADGSGVGLGAVVGAGVGERAGVGVGAGFGGGAVFSGGAVFLGVDAADGFVAAFVVVDLWFVDAEAVVRGVGSAVGDGSGVVVTTTAAAGIDSTRVRAMSRSKRSALLVRGGSTTRVAATRGTDGAGTGGIASRPRRAPTVKPTMTPTTDWIDFESTRGGPRAWSGGRDQTTPIRTRPHHDDADAGWRT
jgi:hypothetical protein